MAATDVAPSRMEAARAAALEFVQNAPGSLRIGVVAFSDAGFSTQVPTDERGLVVAAIQRLEPERGTSLAKGIQTSLTAIDLAEHPPGIDYYTTGSPAPTPQPTPVPSGVHEPAVIVLFSDGENTVNPDPSGAIQAARDRGVRVDTVGIGTRGRRDARDRRLQDPLEPRRGRPPGHRPADRRHVLPGDRPGRPEPDRTTTSNGASS